LNIAHYSFKADLQKEGWKERKRNKEFTAFPVLSRLMGMW
jgi:hypothetical protein